MKRAASWLLASILLTGDACASRTNTPASAPGKLLQVYVSIFGFGAARVRAATSGCSVKIARIAQGTPRGH